MAVLKRFFSSLKKLFSQRLPGGRKKKQRPKTKRKAGKKLFSRRRVSRKSPGKSRPSQPSRKKIKGKRSVPPAKKSLRPASVSAVPAKLPPGKTKPSGQPVGEITHFFAKIRVVVVKMTKGNLAVGDKVRISSPQAPSGQRLLPLGGPLAAGRTKSTDFIQTVRSMQIESVDVRCARRGQLIGLKVEREARVGDKLHKLV